MPNKLERHLAKRIESEGPITIAAFMEEALAHPEFGYYRKKDPLGALGDFTTAPEISQMFGELVGLWSVVVWQFLGSPAKLNLVELGPGRGTLMADALRAMRGMPDCYVGLNIHLVETSPALRDKQKESLAGYDRPVHWHDDLNSLSDDAPVVFIANEFFDALPIRQFQKAGDFWRERHVCLDDKGGFQFTLGNALPIAGAIPAHFQQGEDGAIFEVCPAGVSIAGLMADKIKRIGGAGLIIDYGHSPSGLGDTLQALYKHQYHDVLKDIGDADLTAHVDFEVLGDAARNAGAEVSKVTTQAAFLKGLGIEERAQVLLANATDQQKTDISSALYRLIDQEQMGTLFKVMALTSPGMMMPPGFE